MNKTLIANILLIFLVRVEHIIASSSNLRKRKTTVITAISEIFMNNDWDCCDGTDESTPMPTANVDTPTQAPEKPLSVTSTPTSLRATSTPTTSPTSFEKELIASDADDTIAYSFGGPCSMSGDIIIVGSKHAGENFEGAAYLYNLNGNEINKLTAGDDGEQYDQFGWSVSMDEKVVVGTNNNDYVQVFSLEGDYERTITCDDCYKFGDKLATHGDIVVVVGYQNFDNMLFIHNITDGELLKTIDHGNNWITGVDVSNEVIVSTSKDANKTFVYSNSGPDFNKIVEIPCGGRRVATSGDKLVIGDEVGVARLYNTAGSLIKTLEHDSTSGSYFGYSVAITDENILIGTPYDDVSGENTGSVFIYSTEGELIEKKIAPDGEADDYFGGGLCASDTHYVIGAPGDGASGVAHLFRFSQLY